MRQLSRMAALLVGVAVVCVVSGCGSGGTERAQGTHQAVFTFEIQPGDGVAGVVASRGQTTPVDGVSLKCPEPIGGVPNTGVHRVGDLVQGWVSVVNDNASPITNVQARISWLSRPTDWEHNHLVWNYGAVDAATESAPIRWLFQWTGAGSPDNVADRTTFQVTLTWLSGPMPPLASDFTLTIQPDTSISVGDCMLGTDAAAVDVKDGADNPEYPPGVFDPNVAAYFPHPEWQDWTGDNFAFDIRATILTGGQTKTWDMVVECSDSNPHSIEMTWTAPPAGISVQVIHVIGATDIAPMTTFTSSPITYTHPGQFARPPRFQFVVSAT